MTASSHRPEAGPALGSLDINDFDVVVNNAALYQGDAALLKSLNYDLPVSICRRKTHGQVINILDGTSRPAPWKNELREFTLASHVSCLTSNVRINGVLLGPVLPPDGFHLKADPCPKGRPTVHDVALAVQRLIEDNYANHTIIDVTGR